MNLSLSYILLRIGNEEVKSAMIVVEGNGEDYIGQRSKKYGARQDPSL